MALAVASTNVGVRKSTNQDAYCIKIARTSVGEVVFAVICDGVGGMALGELASATVVKSFSRWFDTGCSSYLKFNTDGGIVDLSRLRGVWTQLLEDVNKTIFSYGCERESGLGTTCSALIICQNSYFAAHVGDCRIYKISESSYSLITKDQTVVQRGLDAKIITEVEAANHPQRNVLLQAVGAQKQVTPKFYSGKCSSADGFLLCCDGLHRSVGESDFVSLFQCALGANKQSMQTTCNQAIEQGIAGGSTDNITVAFINLSSVKMGRASRIKKNVPEPSIPVGASTSYFADEPTSVDPLEVDGATSVLSDEDELTTTLNGDSQFHEGIDEDGFTSVLAEETDECTTVLDDEQTDVLESEKGGLNG